MQTLIGCLLTAPIVVAMLAVLGRYKNRNPKPTNGRRS
jgi:hypothetical protein